MNKKVLKKSNFAEITTAELQIRGGTAWREIFNLVRYLKLFMDFISEYNEDMYRGFKKGWTSL